MSYITPHNQGTIGLSLCYLARKFGANRVKQLPPDRLYKAILKKVSNGEIGRIQDVINLVTEGEAVKAYIHQQQQELSNVSTKQ